MHRSTILLTPFYLKQNIYSILLSIILHSSHINICKFYIEKVKCKDYYWYLIKINHSPKVGWGNTDINFVTTKCTIDTEMQTFQYKIIHRTLACTT